MKRFRFSLEPVLEQRRRVEEEQRLILAQRHRELQLAEDALNRLDAQFREHSERFRSAHKAFGSEELRAHYAHLDYLDRAIGMQHGIVAACRRAVDAATRGVVEASKERKVMEKLKERRREEHEALVAAQEQKDLDDANNRRFARSS